MSAIDDALQANKRYAETFGDKASLPVPPARKIAVVICMDARLDPEKAMGFQEGDAHVIRNAGGRIPDALRSLAISQHLLGTEEVAIVHHTDCGMLTFTDDVMRQKLAEQGVEAGHLAFYPFSDVKGSVKADIKLYNESPIVRHDIPVRGFIFDVKTGLLDEVK